MRPRAHDESTLCWCEPRIIVCANGSRVIVHDEPDERVPDDIVADVVRCAERDDD